MLFRSTNIVEITEGLVYEVDTVVSATNATIKDIDTGTTITITSGASGTIVATVGGLPTTRVTTTLVHGFNNSIVTAGAFEVN